MQGICIHVEVVVFFTGGTAYALLFDMASGPDLARDQPATVYVEELCMCREGAFDIE
jgi:hypothetical protein